MMKLALILALIPGPSLAFEPEQCRVIVEERGAGPHWCAPAQKVTVCRGITRQTVRAEERRMVPTNSGPACHVTIVEETLRGPQQEVKEDR